MGLRNSFPKERQYEFWNIAMCYLIHKQEDLPEKDRTLFGTLAYRMISKAAESIPVDQVGTRHAHSQHPVSHQS
jgi:N-terminal acetyltransferase B complex non-catalytic subunit